MNLPVLPTISTFFIVLSAVLVAIGWILVSNRKKLKHIKKRCLQLLYPL